MIDSGASAQSWGLYHFDSGRGLQQAEPRTAQVIELAVHLQGVDHAQGF